MNLDFLLKLKRSNKVALILIAAVGGSGALWWLAYNRPDEPFSGAPATSTDARGNLPLPEPQLYKPLLPEQAKLENDKLPFSTAPIEKALPVFLPSNELLAIGRRNATDCLTSAIYYEAANESSQGKRAVAQVILNRVRHPAYPKTICGVIYQGSERNTGCQFTFTCDGSLARRPARDRWEQARVVATGAISGAVEPSVGMATHYHANYVLPYWASSLDKVSQIGTHIFYRWKGTWGRRKAFSQTVQLDNETLPVEAVLEIPVVVDDKLLILPNPQPITSPIIADDVISGNSLVVGAPQITASEVSQIRADQARSELVIDEKSTSLKDK